MALKIERTILITANTSTVWKFLTDPNLMEQWIGEPEMEIEVKTDWIVGHPIIIEGFHHLPFRNLGTVIQFDAYSIIQYNHLSSLSKLPDLTHNYTVLTFLLREHDNSTQLSLTIENFPTETIYRHMDFYWQGTLEILRKLIEKEVT